MDIIYEMTHLPLSLHLSHLSFYLRLFESSYTSTQCHSSLLHISILIQFKWTFIFTFVLHSPPPPLSLSLSLSLSTFSFSIDYYVLPPFLYLSFFSHILYVCMFVCVCVSCFPSGLAQYCTCPTIYNELIFTRRGERCEEGLHHIRLNKG